MFLRKLGIKSKINNKNVHGERDKKQEEKLKHLGGILRSISDGNTKRLTQLLRHQVALKLTPDDLVTSLATAIRQCRAECVDAILNAGADANASDDEGRPMLFLLMEHGGGNPAILRSLLEAKANPNKVTWHTQQTPLHAAAKRGYQVCVKHLVIAGAELNRKCSGGQTALMFAAKDGHVTVVRSLLKDGADPNIVSDTGDTALHLATRHEQQSSVEELLAAGCDVNVQDHRGQSPLMLATQANNVHLISLLLDCQASVNVQDVGTGKSVLHYAVETGDLHLLHTLLHRGADPDIRDVSWQTPFMLALNVNRRDMMEKLLKAGCRITNTDRSFNTALHIAASNGQTDMIPLLVERGLSVDIKGNGGVTPVMLAALGGHVDTIDILLEYNADCSLCDRNRANALVYAILADAEPHARSTIVKMLVRSNCNLNQSANLKKVLKMFQLQVKDFTVEDRFYSLLEIAFIRADTASFMMLLSVGADTNNFSCDKDLTVMSFQSEPTDLSSRWALLRRLKRQRRKVRSLRDLCRRPLLTAFKTHLGDKIASLPISDQLKGFLQFSELDEICEKYEQESQPEAVVHEKEPQNKDFARNTKTRRTHSGLPKSIANNPYGTLPRGQKTKAREVQNNFGTLRKIPVSRGTGRQRNLSGSTNDNDYVVTPNLQRRGYSNTTTPLTSPAMPAPAENRFKFPSANQKKVRSRSSRDPRETITNMLHGSAAEYCTTGEITPKPLSMQLIENLSKEQTSPKDDYDSVNTLLYGSSYKPRRSTSLDSQGAQEFQDRVAQKRKEIQERITNKGGVEDYVNAEIHCLTDAITKAWGDEVFQEECSKINDALDKKTNVKKTDETPPDKTGVMSNLHGMQKWTAMEDLKRVNSADIDDGKNLPIMTLNQQENSSIEALPTDGTQAKKPLILVTSTDGTSPYRGGHVPENHELLSPRSVTSSSDSSSIPGYLSFPTGDPQLLHKYLRTQEKVINRPDELPYGSPLNKTLHGKHLRAAGYSPDATSPDHSGSEGCTSPVDRVPKYQPNELFNQQYLTPPRGRTSSVSSHGSHTDPQRKSRIPVMQWNSPRTRLISTEEASSSPQSFRRTKSFRH